MADNGWLIMDAYDQHWWVLVNDDSGYGEECFFVVMNTGSHHQWTFLLEHGQPDSRPTIELVSASVFFLATIDCYARQHHPPTCELMALCDCKLLGTVILLPIKVRGWYARIHWWDRSWRHQHGSWTIDKRWLQWNIQLLKYSPPSLTFDCQYNHCICPSTTWWEVA